MQFKYCTSLIQASMVKEQSRCLAETLKTVCSNHVEQQCNTKHEILNTTLSGQEMNSLSAADLILLNRKIILRKREGIVVPLLLFFIRDRQTSEDILTSSPLAKVIIAAIW